MKKIFTLVLALYSLSAWAHDFEMYGIYYNILDSNNVEVTYCGDYCDSHNEYSRKVTILSYVTTYNGTTYRVTSIGEAAFAYCSQLTSVYIGESVTSIGDYAFYGCSKLSSISIPNNVTSIGKEAFYDCSSLTSVTIGKNVTSIEDWAFEHCSSLTSINVEGNNPNYSSIDGVLFDKYLTILVRYPTGKQGGYTIPNSVTSIGNRAFRDCSSLTSVIIPNSVTSIGDYAFSHCSSLTSITIPNSVTSIGNAAFEHCYDLTSVIIPNSVTSIGNSAFRNCSDLTSVEIPNSVTSIGDKAFLYCSDLTSVEIPNSVTSIGDWAFSGCSGLTSVTIPNSVTSIGNYAFEDFSSLGSIICEATIPPATASFAFDGVSRSIRVYVPCGCVEAYKAASGWEKFINFQESLAKYSIEVNVNDSIMGTAKVDYNTCEGAQITTTPNIGYHFTQWSDGNTENPRTLILTQDTTFTAEFALSLSGQCGENLYWRYDKDTKTISITGSGKMYDYTANTQPWFLFKEQIVEVTTTNTVTSIGTSAFEGSICLSKLSLGTAMEHIAANAFANCRRLYEIYSYASLPPLAETSSFTNYNATLYVPCNNKQYYQSDMVFILFSKIECIDSEEVETDTVIITPGTTDVTITWPTDPNAETYVIVIKQADKVFCSLTFNADGMLLNIAFAPSRSGSHPVTYAASTGNGLRFTVTSLDAATTYGYNVTTKDEEDNTLSTYSGEFTTKGGTTTAVEDILQNTTNTQKLFRDNQLIILRDGKEYNAMGKEM